MWGGGVVCKLPSKYNIQTQTDSCQDSHRYLWWQTLDNHLSEVDWVMLGMIRKGLWINSTT